MSGTDAPVRKLHLTPASNVPFERVEWLVDCWVPRRSLTLLAGREGLGKSTIACDLAARATRGDLNNGEPANVIYLCTEDSPSMTVGPRLKAANADMDRVFFLTVTMEYDDGEISGALDLPADFRKLEREIEDHQIGLVILDAAKSAMNGKIDGNRDEEVRRFLEPMSGIGERQNCVFLALVHFGKRQSSDTGALILGSVAWSQVARSVLSVAKDDDSGLLVVTNTKGNLAPRTVSRECRIHTTPVPTPNGMTEVGRIVWEDGESSRDARDLLRDTADDPDDRSDCEMWLKDYLEDHPDGLLKQDVLTAARKAGFLTRKTLERAFKKLGGQSTNTREKPRRVVWSLHPDSRSRDTGTPHALESVPTVPTGTEQGKRNVPTREKPLLGHDRAYVPTTVPTCDEDSDSIDSLILGSLSDNYPISLRTITGAIPTRDREGVDLEQQLNHLETTGFVARSGNGWIKKAGASND